MHLEINGSVSSAEPMTGASQAPVLCVLTGHTRVHSVGEQQRQGTAKV